MDAASFNGILAVKREFYRNNVLHETYDVIKELDDSIKLSTGIDLMKSDSGTEKVSIMPQEAEDVESAVYDFIDQVESAMYEFDTDDGEDYEQILVELGSDASSLKVSPEQKC